MLKVLSKTPIPRLLHKEGHNLFASVRLLGLTRNITTSTMNLEKVAEELQNNPYFDKYAHKIAQLQKTSPEEFMARLKDNEERKKPKKEDSSVKSTPLAGLPGKAKSGSITFTKPKLLSDVMKTELIEGKSADEIRDIWIEYHKNKDCITASIPVEKFDLIQSRGEKFPIFVLPLPRDQGYEFIMCQFSGNEVHFTPLISYQAHKENAPECLTLIYYADLKESKKLVLMKGEFNKDVLTVVEAQCLANELQLYYGEENEKRTRLLERFTYSPDDFKHMDLIANLESLSF